MIATLDCSRICRHNSKPSTSGSIRSSRTMSGSSVSSSCSARVPSADTTLSKPRTARFDLIRSTMFGSSSTTSARVFLVFSVMTAQSLPGFLGLAYHAFADEAVPVPVVGAGTVAGLHRQANAEARAAGRAAQFDAAAVRLDDGLGDGQPEPGPGAGGAALRGDVERGRQFPRHAGAVVDHADHDLGGRRGS